LVKEFFDPAASPKEASITPRTTPMYKEFEALVPGVGALYIYLASDDPRILTWMSGTPTACSFQFQTCVNDMLTPYFELTLDPVRGDQWMALLCETFPTFKSLWVDSEADRLDNGGLRWVPDPDTSESKHMIVFTVDEVAWDPVNWQTLFDIPRIKEGFLRATQRTMGLLFELSEKKIDPRRALDLGLLTRAEGRTEAVSDAIKKITDWAGFIRDLGG
jgi:hypothetical protein